MNDPPTGLELVGPLHLRRALLAVLLADGGPLAIDDVIARLARDHGISLDLPVGVSPRRRISDMLRYQARVGRVVRVQRGVYAAVPGAMSRSTIWRCHNWRHVRDRTWDAL